ncbi:hypothetical protein QFZ31_004463 [Neobacillus niacini]|uniref:hypothetical protein n=1 Tax=Neobacillus driksii TaxID=3035913 RepID=UPI002781592D|nr:hypothetical protein [Neobacillus niacini]MDQ0974585.1 hypothetical protein [Neobacillus niacini]
MQRRNFLVTFILWILSFFIGYKVGKADDNESTLSDDNKEGLAKIDKRFATKLDIAAVLTIYVSPAGDDNNDGLSQSAPFRTLQRAFDLIKNTYSVIDGKINVDLAPGTYEQSASISNVMSKNRIEIIGKKGANGIPTVIFEGGKKEDLSCAMLFSDYMNVMVQDIKIQNYANNVTRSGIITQNYTNLWTKNVHAENCGFAGINVNLFSRLYVEGGTVDNCRIGIRVYSNSICTIGYNNQTQSLSDPNHTIIKNCTETGILLYNMSTGHVDYSELDRNRVGIIIQNSSRLHVMKNLIKNSEVLGVQVTTSSTWYNNENIYKNNAQDYKHFAFSTEEAQSEEYTPLLKVHPTCFIDKVTHTGNLGEVNFNTINEKLVHSLQANSFVKKGQKLKVIINGTFLGPGVKTVRIRLGNELIASFPSIKDSKSNFALECDLFVVNSINLKVVGKWTEGNVAFNTLFSDRKTASLATNQNLIATGELSDKKGYIIIESFEVREIA